MPLPRLVCWLALLPVVGLPSVAAAQSWSGDPKRTATAQSLFEQARVEMQAGDYRSACPRLEEVVRLEPSGAGAKLKLAECYEGAGRLASAYAMYTLAEASARAAQQPDRERWAAGRGAALKPRLSTVVIVLEESTAKLPGLTVERDGVEVGSGQWGSKIPVDGGEVVVVARAPGHMAFRAVLSVKAEADAQEVTVALEPEPVPMPTEAVAPAAPAAPSAPSAPIDRVVPPPPVAARSSVPAWVWITGGMGLASGLAGIGFRIDGAVVEGEQAEVCGPRRDACPASYDVDGTNTRKQRDFALFVGLGASGALATGAALIGLAVGLAREPQRAAALEPWWALDDTGFAGGVRGRL